MGKKYKKKIERTLIDIVIPVMNRFDILEDCLQAIPDALSPHPYQVYIFDNGSNASDANKFYSTIQDKRIDVHRSGQNLGFPKACNLGARKGRSPLVFFLNSDVILEPGSIDYCVRCMDDPSVAICGMKLVFPSNEEIIDAKLDMQARPAKKLQHIGIITNIRGQLGHAFLTWDADHPRVNAVSDIMAVTGAALMTRRKLFREAGGFDEIYGKGTFEDVDLALKMREMGYNVKVVPEAVGTHYTGATAEVFGGFPMGENYQKFLMRWRSKLKQTDIEVL